MPQSIVKILTHIVFSTKNRADLILPEFENDLFGYIAGIVKNNKSKLIAINGTENHVHLLVSVGKQIQISDLVGDIKRSSSYWIKRRGNKSVNFYWQSGYGAFSVSQSQVDSVVGYIKKKSASRRSGF